MPSQLQQVWAGVQSEVPPVPDARIVGSAEAHFLLAHPNVLGVVAAGAVGRQGRTGAG